MIVSKPKLSALLALGIFSFISISVGAYALSIIMDDRGLWYHYVISGVFLSVGLVLFIRQLLSYKLVSIGDNKLRAAFPFKGIKKEYSLADIVSWKEEVIKTKNASFRQLEVQFDDFLLKLTIQENTQYEQILGYLKKKVSKKQVR
ncbi:MAG: hypothetical protein KDC79_05155 [Cyclobacteriaceae bacterium]|nr:hypothetical protein [Cyclobacteriaceae bacterium]